MRRFHTRISLTALTSLALAGCSNDPGNSDDSSTSNSSDTSSDDPSDSTADTSTDDALCPPPFAASETSVFDQSSNRFVFESGENYAMFNGAFYPEVKPSFHHESDRDGLCRLLTYTQVPCDPECPFEQVCASGTCITPLAAQGIGDLELRGVNATAIDLQVDGIAHYSWQSEPFTATAQATITLSGSDQVNFTTSACPMPALAAKGEWSQLMQARQPGEDVTFTWDDPLPHARIYLRMTTGIGTHGGISPVEIECEGPDRGTLTLPGAYLDQLYDGPFWSCGECGDNRLQRYHASEVTIDGSDVLQLRAQRSHAFFYHPGRDG